MPAGVTAKWSANGVSATGAAMVSSTLTLSSTTAAGIGSTTLKIAAVGDGLAAQTLESLQVTAAPAISVALTPAAVAMTSTGTSQVVVTTTLIGGVTPAANLAGVGFSATGLPVGIVATWGKASQSVVGTLQATLTLTGNQEGGCREVDADGFGRGYGCCNEVGL